VRRKRRIDAAYLYGSHVNGTASKWSDIDLAVISADFSGDVFEDRLALMRIAARVDDRIEPHPFTPQRFDASDPLVGEICRTGIRVA
jgi:predicted nucleotidyltransferase